jgi:hypothetical protein
MQKYTYHDQVFTFEDCISVEEQNSWVMPWRIDFRQPTFYPGLEEQAAEALGVRLSFRTNSIGLVVFLAEPHPGLKLGLFVDGLFIQEAQVNSAGQVVFDPLPFGTKTIEIWLDHRYPCKLEAVAIDPGARIAANPPSQKRWILYGGRNHRYEMSGTASTLWSTLVAKKLNLHLTNLSFEGVCRFEPMTARLIRDLPADFITAFPEPPSDTAAIDPSLFYANLIGWIQIIREQHPEVPIALVTPPTGGFEVAEVLAQAVENCQMYGDHLVFLVFGSLIDKLSDKGRFREKDQMVLAERFLDEVFFKTFC